MVGNRRISLHSAPQLLDVVELAAGRPDAGLAAGSLGTIGEILDARSYLVEFCDASGRTLAIETLSESDFRLA